MTSATAPIVSDAIAKKAKRAAKAVFADLSDRRGFRQALDECDADVIKEIKTTIADIIAKEMAKP